MKKYLAFSLFCWVSFAGNSLVWGDTLRIYFTHSKQAGFEDAIAKLKAHIEKETGFTVETTIASPGDHTEIVEALGNGRADVAFFNTFSYLFAHDLYGAQATLQILRGDELATYQGQIVAHADSKISSVKDLDGKRFAFKDKYSATGYLLPEVILRENQVTVFSKHLKSAEDILEDVYQKKVDAGATYYLPNDKKGNFQDARRLLVQKYPDIAKKIVIIAKTKELMNEPVVFRAKLSEETKKKATAAFESFADDSSNKKALNAIYNITGFKPITDADYASARRLISAAGKEVSDVVPQGGSLAIKEYKGNAKSGKGSSGQSSELHRAVREADYDKTAELIGKQNVNAPDESGNTPLHLAAAARGIGGQEYWQMVQIVKLLLQKNANPKLLNDQKKSPLDLAKLSGNSEIIELLEKPTGK